MIGVGEHLILTLDSSSTMALIQLETLSQIEKATGKKIPELFEWIVASGVGGFLMMAMVYCKYLNLITGFKKGGYKNGP